MAAYLNVMVRRYSIAITRIMTAVRSTVMADIGAKNREIKLLHRPRGAYTARVP
jgi:hypothetical protein